MESGDAAGKYRSAVAAMDHVGARTGGATSGGLGLRGGKLLACGSLPIIVRLPVLVESRVVVHLRLIVDRAGVLQFKLCCQSVAG